MVMIDEVSFIELLVFTMFVVLFFLYRYQVRSSYQEHLTQHEDIIDQNVILSSSDIHGNITATTQALCNISGYTKEELIGQNHRLFRHPDTLNSVFKDLWETIESGEVWSHELKNLKKDGGFYWVDIKITPLFDNNGTINGYTALRQDITNKKIAEELLQELKDQKELYELVFKSSGSSVLILDIEKNNFIDCNISAIKILKCNSKDEVLHLKPFTLSPEFQPDGRRSDEKYKEMKQLSIEKGSYTFEWKYLTKTHEEIWVEVVLTPIILDSREVLHVVWKDIAEKKRYEEDLKEQQVLLLQQSRLASMGEMIGNISHQWRQPLSALSLLVQKVSIYNARNVLDDKKIAEITKKGLYLIDGMSSTIDDFRDFFEPKKSKELFDIEEAIGKSYKMFESSFTHSLIEYKFEVDSKQLNVYGYMGEFSQVMINLLKNAKDALVENNIASPYIHVRLQKEATNLRISVCDNAGGIPDNIKEKIFDPYFTTKEEGKGTGIGLYMSKIIIEDHMDGVLQMSNSKDGSCFVLLLPLEK